MTDHFIIRCKGCDAVIAQCRCPGGPKRQTFQLCDSCKHARPPRTMEEIKMRWAKATGHGWEACDYHKVIHGRGGCRGQIIIANYPHIPGDCEATFEREADMDAIANAPDDVAWLITELELSRKG